MKKWEDIFKDKLGGMEITLPEGSLAEFRTRLDGAESASPVKRFPFGWVMAAAIAAGLAAVLFLCQPTVPENGIQVIRQPESPVAVVPDSIDVSETAPAQSLIAQASMPKPIVHHIAISKEPIIEENPVKTEETVPDKPVEDSAGTEGLDTSTPKTQEGKTIDNPVIATASPFIPSISGTKNVRLKVGSAVGIVGGGSMLAAVVPPIIFGGTYGDPVVIDPTSTEDIPTGSDTHYFPIKVGLSAGIPVADRLRITTGLEYSLYCSNINYSLSGDKQQFAHYLGVPVRLDWIMASNKWLNIYIGGGVEGDYCLGVRLDGDKIKGDGLAFSLLGAGGIQFNASKHIGLYVEPGLSWTIPSKTQTLETYRSSRPVMFFVATGLRINLGMK